MKDIAITLKNIRKSYVFRDRRPTISERIIKPKKTNKFVALDGISFEIMKGERVGIFGQNGSGKTTLLKIIAGITKPDCGGVSVSGRVVSLIDLSAGFHPDLTGRENIYLNGLMIGMSRREIEDKIDEIIEFTEIAKFIDQSVYTYSLGMKLRLGFSIAVNSDPDILLLDEGFVTGDKDFQEKSFKKLQEIFNQKKTIIMITHILPILENNCNRFIWIDQGKIYKDGKADVIKEYMKGSFWAKQ